MEKNNFAVPIISVIVIIILGVIIVVASKPNHNDGKCDICGSKDLVIDTSSSELCSTEEQDLYKFDKEIIHWQKQILELFKQRKESKISTEEYNKRYKNYSTKVFELQAKQTELKDKSLALQLNHQRLIEITEVFSSNATNLASDNMMKLLVECINVKSKHELEFQFKCGILANEQI